MDPQGCRANVLLKSKSSNTRVKPRVAEKKSKSNGEFKNLLVKKRGVYVEKRRSSTEPFAAPVIPAKVKAPPRSRPGAKPFLASVLTILSKTTASTQTLTVEEKQITKRTSKMSKSFLPVIRSKHNNEDDIKHNTVKKPRYKPKFENYAKSQTHRVPSNVSKDSRSSRKLIEAQVDYTVSKAIEESIVTRCVLEGNRLNLEKEMLDPMTLVSGVEKDDKLYSLFVNLIETVCNAKPDEKIMPCLKSVKSFKTENVDDLLDIEGKTGFPPCDLFLGKNSLSKVVPQTFDLKWCNQDTENKIEESLEKIKNENKLIQKKECKVLHKVVKKTKYRSKALNDEVNKEPERVVVLKSKNSSSFSKDTCGSNVSLNSETGEAIEIQNTINLDSSIAKSVMEGNRLNMDKENIATTTTSAPEKDNKLYSLFVNLLESVYTENPAPQETIVEGSPQSSKLKFEMDANVAQKLDDVIQKTYEYVPPPCEQCNYKPRKEWHPNVQLSNQQDYDTRWYTRDFESEVSMRRFKKKVRRHFANKPTTAPRVLDSHQPTKKRNSKQELLAMFKHQLSIEDDSYKEPKTFYDALRLMARSRRSNYNDLIRCPREVIDDSDFDSTCRFKKRKVAPRYTQNTRTRNIKAKPEYSQFKYSYSDYRPHSYEAESIVSPDSDDSYHSLAVYGYDYEWKPHSPTGSYISVGTNNGEYNWLNAVAGSQCCCNNKK